MCARVESPPRSGVRICSCAARISRRVDAWTRRATIAWPWRSRCSAPSPGQRSGSLNGLPSPSATLLSSPTSDESGKGEGGRVTLRVIAIDGPAASGKDSTAAAVARRLGWAHLDSGALYRALTLAALDHHGEQEAGSRSSWSAQRIIALAEELPVRLVLVGDGFRPEGAGVDVEEAIRSERVTRRVSELAAIPEVRHWVNVQQRDAALRHSAGVVVDGRDIGTVVFPDAPLKVFLIASPEERARRRLAQRGERGGRWE